MSDLDAEHLERQDARLVLINNERRKLMANAFDRLSTAFVAIGVLGQVLSFSPASASVNSISGIAAWIVGALILHLIARRVLGGLKA